MRNYYVYILAKHRHGALYVGVTNDLIRRMHEHRTGAADGFTKRHGLKTLVWFEEHRTAAATIQREKNLKHWSRGWKIRLIEKENPTWGDLWEEVSR
jgi:putative endonuclease